MDKSQPEEPKLYTEREAQKLQEKVWRAFEKVNDLFGLDPFEAARLESDMERVLRRQKEMRLGSAGQESLN